MSDFLQGIILGIIACFLYDILKKWFITNFKKDSTEKSEDGVYSISSLKMEFYICFPVGLFFLLLGFWFSDTLSVIFTLLSVFLLFLALCAFMCAIESIKYFQNNLSNKNTDNNT